MIRLKLIRPGREEVEVVTVPGNSAVLGRDEGQCDIVVGSGAKSSISKRHVQILRGLVLVDLNSTNGTFVNGEKVTQPVLLEGGSFNLANKLDVEVVPEEIEEDAAPAGEARTFVSTDPDTGEGKLLRVELERERERAAALASELAEARERAEHGGKASDDHLATLQAENADLRRRLDSLKGESEEREVEASESLQVRLLQQQLEELQRHNQELAARSRELEGRLSAAAKPGAPMVADSNGELARLRSELEHARKAALPPSEFFAELVRETETLRERLERFERGDASPALPASDLFLQLQAENRVLRERIDALSAAPTPRAKAREGNRAEPSEELATLRIAKTRAEAEVARLERELAALRKTPVAVVRARAEAGGGVLGIVARMMERDAEKVGAEVAVTTEEFFVLETLRFLRGAERLVTRVAGQIVQLYEPHTMLPDMGGQNLRSIAKRILADANDAAAQDELSRYLAQLSRWLVAIFAAQRKAAVELALAIKADLSEEALTEGKPIPGMRVLPGQREAELWRRASERLKGMSEESLEDRFEQLGRQTAQKLLGSQENPA